MAFESPFRNNLISFCEKIGLPIPEIKFKKSKNKEDEYNVVFQIYYENVKAPKKDENNNEISLPEIKNNLIEQACSNLLENLEKLERTKPADVAEKFISNSKIKSDITTLIDNEINNTLNHSNFEILNNYKPQLRTDQFKQKLKNKSFSSDPISILNLFSQDIKLPPPKYTTNSQQNYMGFLTKCSFQNFETQGIGPNKNLSKIEAAIKMCDQLGMSDFVKVEQKQSLNLPNFGYESSQDSIKYEAFSPQSFSTPTRTSSTSSSSICTSPIKMSSNVNYVGVVNEYFQKRNIPSPIYQDSVISSVPHMPQFISKVKFCINSVENCIEGEWASTKKEAKKNAARKLYEHLRNGNL